MTEHEKEIIEESERTIERLYGLSVFFEEPSILKIYLQTQVIHKLFVDNSDMDVNKLELFHVQFTNTLIDLLDKIKRRNDRLVGMYQSEIELNEELAEKIRTAITLEGSFEAEKKEQTQRVARSIYSFHKALSSQSSEYPFTENISSFSVQFYKDYFYEVDNSYQEKLLAYESNEVYRNRYGLIGRDVLNSLAQRLYKIDFLAGIRAGNMLMEIYQIGNEEKYFVFIPAKNYFLPCDVTVFPYKEWQEEANKKRQGIKDLLQKNIQLERDIRQNAKLIDEDIITLLSENQKRISEVDFLEDLEKIDVQANTLKTMLETKMI